MYICDITLIIMKCQTSCINNASEITTNVFLIKMDKTRAVDITVQQRSDMVRTCNSARHLMGVASFHRPGHSFIYLIFYA